MQSILKKTLIAAAVASVASTAGAATLGTVDTSAAKGIQSQKISAEGYAIVGSIAIETTIPAGATAPTAKSDALSLTFKPGTTYNNTDVLVLTITGATLTNTSASQIKLNNTSAIGVDAAAGTITFRPEGAGATFDSNTTYAITGVKLNKLTSSVTVSSVGKTSGGLNFDSGSAVRIATMSSQFGAKPATGLNREIDVENARKQFTTVNQGTNEGTTKDSATFTLSNSADIYAATVTTSSLTLKGTDLEFLKDKNGKLTGASYDLIGATEDTSTAKAAKLTGASLVVNSTNAPATGTGAFGITLIADGAKAAGAQVLQPQSFTADVGLSYNYKLGAAPATSGSASFSGMGAGTWTLSGAQSFVEFMPFGAGITQFVYVSNTSAVSGDIEVTAYDQSGTMFGPVKLAATATGKSVTNITNALISALTDAGVNTNTGRISFNLVINSPKAAVEVTAGYNSRGNRVLIK